MPTQQHDVSAELFRWRPRLAGELLIEMGVDIPDIHDARDVSESFTDLKTSEYTGDAAVVMKTSAGRHGVVVEIQRGSPEDKEWTWPLYIAVLRARQHCPVALLVIAPDPAIADQCAKPIDTGHPDHVLRPLVLRPEHVPILTDPQEIITDIPMAVLSAMFHGGGPCGAEVIQGAFGATNLIAENDRAKARQYYDYVLAMLPEVARKSLEVLMETESRYYSDFFRNAEAAGVAKGKAEDVLRVLEIRGIEVSEERRERILACTDHEQLDVWLERAVTAHTVADFIG